MNADNQVSLTDVVKLALPLNTKPLGNANQRAKIVNWGVVLTDWAMVRDQVQLGDLVIVPSRLQEASSNTQLVAGLKAMHSIAAVGLLLFHPVDSGIAAEAEKYEIPILLVPKDASMREIQRNIASLLLDRQSQVTDRGMQLYRELSEMSREDMGLEAMTDLMAKVTGKLVVVQDKRLDIQAMSVPQGAQYDMGRLTSMLQQRDELPSSLRNRKAAAKKRESHWQTLFDVENIGRLLCPIISGDRARGYLSVIGPAHDLDMLDKLTVEHGAAAVALEMAKAKAVSEAKKELRGDFLEGVLAGSVPRSEMERLRVRLDHDTNQPHAVVTFGWENQDQAPPVRYIETAVNWLLSSHNRPALVHIYGGMTVCMFQALRNTDDDMGSVKELERRLREYVKVEYPKARMVSGLGGPTETLNEWPTIYQQAVQAMKLGQRLGMSMLVEYDSLGVYQLLTQLDDIVAVQQFCERIISPLATYDKRHRSNLVATIDAYFGHHGNISQTAESLFIHRNTLLYRLDRIKDLTDHDLSQADMRLALHLALKLWQLRPETT